MQVEQSSPNSAVTLASGGGGANNSFSVLYGKFRAISSSMKVVVEQLEERQTKYLECQQVVSDCVLCDMLLASLCAQIHAKIERTMRENIKACD